MLMSVAAMLGLLDRLRFEPFPDIRDLSVEAKKAAGDDGLDGRIRRQDRRARIEVVQPLAAGRRDRPGASPGRSSQARSVPRPPPVARLPREVERAVAVHRVDHGDDAFERITDRQVGMVEHRVQDRRGIGKAGRLDDHPAERRDAPVVALAQQILQGGDEVTAHGAAKATGRKQDHVVVDVSTSR